MEMANAITNSRGGIVVEVGVGVKPRNPDRCPSWKIHTINPRTANSVSALRIIAFSGIRTLPVKRNNIKKLADDHDGDRDRQTGTDRVLLVDDVGRRASYLDRLARRGCKRSDLVDEVLGWPTRRDEVVLYLPVAHISVLISGPAGIGDLKTGHISPRRALYGSHASLQ